VTFITIRIALAACRSHVEMSRNLPEGAT